MPTVTVYNNFALHHLAREVILGGKDKLIDHVSDHDLLQDNTRAKDITHRQIVLALHKAYKLGRESFKDDVDQVRI